MHSCASGVGNFSPDAELLDPNLTEAASTINQLRVDLDAAYAAIDRGAKMIDDLQSQVNELRSVDGSVGVSAEEPVSEAPDDTAMTTRGIWVPSCPECGSHPAHYRRNLTGILTKVQCTELTWDCSHCGRYVSCVASLVLE